MTKTRVMIAILLVAVAATISFYYTDKQALEDLKLKVTDGPYIFANNDQLNALWLCNGELEKETLDSSTLPLSLSYCDLSANVHAMKATTTDVLEYNGKFDVAAISDFHGQYDLMMQILSNNNIVDAKAQWMFGNGHLVITGDVFDRGDKVTEILWFLYELEQQALQQGGRVHLLLGNHEVMVLNGDLRYLHPKYVETANTIGMPFEQLFAKNTILGDWLRAKPVLVKVNNMLFAHGGFHPSLAREKRTLSDINTVFKNNLVKAELTDERQGWAKYLHKSDGPIWYRGYFKDNGASSEEIDLLLSHFDVQHIVVGHTSQDTVQTRHKGRVIAIDSSIKKGQSGEILLVKGEHFIRGDHMGNQHALR